MGLWKRFKRAVARFFSGGGGGGGSSPSRRVYNNRDSRRVTSSNTSARRAYINAYKGERDDLNRGSSISDAWEKTRKAFRAYSSKATSDPKETLRQSARENRKKETKDWYKATNYRYDVSGAKDDTERLKRRQAVKSRAFDASTAVKEEKHELKYHPYAYSAARRGARGLSLAGELLEKKGAKGEAKKAQQYFEKNQNKIAGGIGEAAGTMAAFALTANPSKAVVKKALPKAVRVSAEKGGEKLAARLAEKKLIRKAAEKEVKNAVKKGITKKVTKSAVENATKQKAKEIVSNLGEDFAQNITTGAINDISRASANHKVGSKGWRRELAASGELNFGLGGAATVGVPALGKGVKRALGGVSEGVENVVKKDNAAYEALARKAGLSTLELPRVSAKKQAPKVKVDLGRKRTTDLKLDSIGHAGGVGSRTKNVAKVAVDDVVRKEPPRRQATIEDVVADASSNRQTTIDDVVNASTEEIRVKSAKDNIVAEMEEAHRVAADTSRPDTERQAAADRWSELNDELNEFEASAETTTKKTPPKTDVPKKKAEADEKAMLEGVQREREVKIDSALRNKTEGEYGYRQGEHTATAHASIDEARRIESEQQRIYKQLKEGDIDELFEDADTNFGIFKTANKGERQRVAGEAAVRVRDDAYGVVSRLKEKAQRLTENLTKNSALSSAEHVTLDDIADITAMRNMFDDAGMTLPDEYEEAFSRIIEWQRTEAAQMLKAVDLFLKENDANYRRAFIQRDMDNYLRKVLRADASDIADIKRSLDANNGEGYWDRMITALSEYKGSKSEAEFRKAYADFQAEVFMNTKPTVWDTVNLWRHAFMLSSPKTGANNIIGNVMQRAMYRIADEFNIALESGASRFINPEIRRTTAHLKTADQRRLARIYTSGKRGQANLKNSANYLKGFDDEAFADAINIASDADVADMMASSKYMGDVVKGLKYKPTTVGGKVKGGLTKAGALQNEYVSLMLNEPDSWFVERNYRMSLLKYLEANGISDSKGLATKEGQKLFREARAYAKDIALENTYKKANRVVSFLEGLRRKGHTSGSGAGYKVAAFALDAEVPYLKVPTNLVINNFKYSPLGAFKGGIDASRAVMKGDVEMLNRATRELSKGLTGTAMMALGYMMFCRDQMDDDSWGFIGNAKDELKEYGVRDNSFKIGNKNFNIANMGIGSVQFLMGASLAEDLAESGETVPYQIALDAINKTVDVVADMSLMENAVSLLDAFGNGGDYDATLSDRIGRATSEIAGDYAAQFIPNPLRGVAKGITEADLDTGVKKGDTTKVERLIERNVNNVVQGVPFLNERVLAHKVDTHGNLINERKTDRDKVLTVLNNTLNPFSTNTVNIPKADKEELKVTKENGEAFKPKGFDKDRTYTAKIGTSKNAEIVDLNRKEREQVARSAKRSGYDGALSLVNSGMFGDRLGDRAQSILANIPEDEEKAREFIFSTPEWQSASNEKKAYFLNKWYGEGQGNNNKGVSRTRKEEAYVNIAGNSEGDFRFQNDLHYKQQDKYYDNNLESVGIDKGTWADILQACKDSNHKWKEDEQKNVDTINSAKKTKAALLAMDGLTPEQRVAAYQALRGKRNGFGWNDWDGVSLGGSGYSRRGGRRRRGGGGSSKTVKTSVPIKVSDFKASKSTYKDMAAALQPRSTSKKRKSTKTTTTRAKIEPPKVKFKKYTI